MSATFRTKPSITLKEIFFELYQLLDGPCRSVLAALYIKKHGFQLEGTSFFKSGVADTTVPAKKNRTPKGKLPFFDCLSKAGL